MFVLVFIEAREIKLTCGTRISAKIGNELIFKGRRSSVRVQSMLFRFQLYTPSHSIPEICTCVTCGSLGAPDKLGHLIDNWERNGGLLTQCKGQYSLGAIRLAGS
jgi:hypothetical protein